MFGEKKTTDQNGKHKMEAKVNIARDIALEKKKSGICEQMKSVA